LDRAAGLTAASALPMLLLAGCLRQGQLDAAAINANRFRM